MRAGRLEGRGRADAAQPHCPRDGSRLVVAGGGRGGAAPPPLTPGPRRGRPRGAARGPARPRRAREGPAATRPHAAAGRARAPPAALPPSPAAAFVACRQVACLLAVVGCEVAALVTVVGCEVAALGAGAGSVAVAAGPRARVLADARAVPVVTIGAAVRFITGLPRFTGLVRIRRVRWLTGTLRLLRVRRLLRVVGLIRGRRLARVRGEARIEADDDRVVVRGTEHARLVEVDHVVAVAGVLGHHGFGGVDGPVRGAGDTAAAGLVGDDVVQGAD